MTQIDFYILRDSQPAALPLFTCRLTEKAYRKGHRVYIHAGSGQQLRQLDDLLWTFRDGSFLPHGLHEAGSSSDQPVLLGHALEPEGPGDVLLNLGKYRHSSAVSTGSPNWSLARTARLQLRATAIDSTRTGVTH
jgi:DNA polymerase-3 subunit chi